jgi:hypothetical protein
VSIFSTFFQNELVTYWTSPQTNTPYVFKIVSPFYLSFAKKRFKRFLWFQLSPQATQHCVASTRLPARYRLRGTGLALHAPFPAHWSLPLGYAVPGHGSEAAQPLKQIPTTNWAITCLVREWLRHIRFFIDSWWCLSQMAVINFCFMLKGPAANATDEPQPWGVLCNPVMKKINFFRFFFSYNGAQVEWNS